MEHIFRKNYTVQGNDVDFSMKMKLSSMFTRFASMASEHADILGVGRNAMQKYDVIWVLLRAKVEVIKYPKWNENIIIETWPEQPNKIDFHRNFIVYDSENNLIAKAMTVWVIIDQKSRKIKKSSFINPEFPNFNKEKAISCELGKIKPSGNLENVYKKTVGYSDIDINEHLNNSKYVDYIMDCFSINQHKNYFVKSIEVDYVHEALAGDSIVLYWDLSKVKESIIYIQGINEETKSDIFKAQIEIEKIN
ncbi:MAG: acyl-ACP thioesterase [Bacillota bacterium]|nr:acyl-ACP thioesterase [Bacillota bacterium]